MSKAVIERQVFVTWYTPEEKMPEEGEITIVSVSANIGPNVEFDHTFALAEWYDDGCGWSFTDNVALDTLAMVRPEALTVHAWCDLEPYGGKK